MYFSVLCVSVVFINFQLLTNYLSVAVSDNENSRYNFSVQSHILRQMSNNSKVLNSNSYNVNQTKVDAAGVNKEYFGSESESLKPLNRRKKSGSYNSPSVCFDFNPSMPNEAPVTICEPFSVSNIKPGESNNIRYNVGPGMQSTPTPLVVLPSSIFSHLNPSKTTILPAPWITGTMQSPQEQYNQYMQTYFNAFQHSQSPQPTQYANFQPSYNPSTYPQMYQNVPQYSNPSALPPNLFPSSVETSSFYDNRNLYTNPSFLSASVQMQQQSQQQKNQPHLQKQIIKHQKEEESQNIAETNSDSSNNNQKSDIDTIKNQEESNNLPDPITDSVSNMRQATIYSYVPIIPQQHPYNKLSQTTLLAQQQMPYQQLYDWNTFFRPQLMNAYQAAFNRNYPTSVYSPGTMFYIQPEQAINTGSDSNKNNKVPETPKSPLIPPTFNFRGALANLAMSCRIHEANDKEASRFLSEEPVALLQLYVKPNLHQEIGRSFPETRSQNDDEIAQTNETSTVHNRTGEIQSKHNSTSEDSATLSGTGSSRETSTMITNGNFGFYPQQENIREKLKTQQEMELANHVPPYQRNEYQSSFPIRILDQTNHGRKEYNMHFVPTLPWTLYDPQYIPTADQYSQLLINSRFPGVSGISPNLQAYVRTDDNHNDTLYRQVWQGINPNFYSHKPFPLYKPPQWSGPGYQMISQVELNSQNRQLMNKANERGYHLYPYYLSKLRQDESDVDHVRRILEQQKHETIQQNKKRLEAAKHKISQQYRERHKQQLEKLLGANTFSASRIITSGPSTPSKGSRADRKLSPNQRKSGEDEYSEESVIETSTVITLNGHLTENTLSKYSESQTENILSRSRESQTFRKNKAEMKQHNSLSSSTDKLSTAAEDRFSSSSIFKRMFSNNDLRSRVSHSDEMPVEAYSDMTTSKIASKEEFSSITSEGTTIKPKLNESYDRSLESATETSENDSVEIVTITETSENTWSSPFSTLQSVSSTQSDTSDYDSYDTSKFNTKYVSTSDVRRSNEITTEYVYGHMNILRNKYSSDLPENDEDNYSESESFSDSLEKNQSDNKINTMNKENGTINKSLEYLTESDKASNKFVTEMMSSNLSVIIDSKEERNSYNLSSLSQHHEISSAESVISDNSNNGSLHVSDNQTKNSHKSLNTSSDSRLSSQSSSHEEISETIVKANSSPISMHRNIAKAYIQNLKETAEARSSKKSTIQSSSNSSVEKTENVITEEKSSYTSSSNESPISRLDELDYPENFAANDSSEVQGNFKFSKNEEKRENKISSEEMSENKNKYSSSKNTSNVEDSKLNITGIVKNELCDNAKNNTVLKEEKSSDIPSLRQNEDKDDTRFSREQDQPSFSRGSAGVPTYRQIYSQFPMIPANGMLAIPTSMASAPANIVFPSPVMSPITLLDSNGMFTTDEQYQPQRDSRTLNFMPLPAPYIFQPYPVIYDSSYRPYPPPDHHMRNSYEEDRNLEEALSRQADENMQRNEQSVVIKRSIKS